MAKNKAAGGEAGFGGSLSLKRNPEAANEQGVTYDETWARAEFAEGKLTARIFGCASFTARSGRRDVIEHRDIEDPALTALRKALQQLIEDYEPQIKDLAMRAAYKARDHAESQGEI